VTNRIQELEKRVSTVTPAPVEEEDYEPGLELMDLVQVRNRNEMESSENLDIRIPTSSLLQSAASRLPPPLRLTERDLEFLSRSSMDVVFRKLEAHPSKSTTSSKKSGLNRIAASSNDKDAMAVTFARLLTRPSACFHNDGQQLNKGLKPQVLSDRGRLKLLKYIFSNWKARMDIATTWLTEEWYNDQICKRTEMAKIGQMVGKDLHDAPNFKKWIHRVLDELSAFIGSEDSKLLIRFVSEIPGIDQEILAKIQRLANDPERISMVVNTIQ
jgi:symplekin